MRKATVSFVDGSSEPGELRRRVGCRAGASLVLGGTGSHGSCSLTAAPRRGTACWASAARAGAPGTVCWRSEGVHLSKHEVVLPPPLLRLAKLWSRSTTVAHDREPPVASTAAVRRSALRRVVAPKRGGDLNAPAKSVISRRAHPALARHRCRACGFAADARDQGVFLRPCSSW
jgi:hypothetical protein